ncbi:pyruvate dehydrogenase [Frankia sp. B2]|uniref:pyruvate dehydrogenase n=1 Tax=Frankia sp. BMG5.23 TaxID=683305 RepID=UPI00068DE1C8|nr:MULTISPECIES: pyruvate dehydrogenase [unclassified Frankia]TFE25155.1 pyruvate dehydrogenase [Frankia sp. B2]
MRRPDVRPVEAAHTRSGRGDMIITPDDAAGPVPARSVDPPVPGTDGRVTHDDRAEGGGPPGDASPPTGPTNGDDVVGTQTSPTAARAIPGPPDPAMPDPAMPGPPGGVLDLAALAAVERRLRSVAARIIDGDERAGQRPAVAAESERAAVASVSSIATVLWFDALRAEDRVSVTPRAAPLIHAVHHVLAHARPTAEKTAAEKTTAASPVPAVYRLPHVRPGEIRPNGVRSGPDGRPLRALGAGNIGPSGTVWAALARRYAGERFDRTPRGRQICLIDYSELHDPTVWETITDERVAHLGELFWVVTVSGSAPTGPVGGIGKPARAARMFEAAGWQVLTVRYGRVLEALFRAPGGHALRNRLDQLPMGEYRALLQAHGADLRRRLAGPGASGAGISRLLDTLTDDEIHACLRDLGGHDLPLLIDAFDEVAADRPTVLFAYTSDELAREERSHDEQTHGEQTADHASAAPSAGPGTPPAAGGGTRPVLRPGDDAAAHRLARHVAGYLDRVPVPLGAAPPVPTDSDHRFPAWISTQEAFGGMLRDLPRLAPQAATAVLTISTRNADPVLADWLAAADRTDGEQPGRHVAGGLSATAFGGVLASLGVAWSRQGLPLLPIGVADEVAAGRVLPGWMAGATADARSILAVADTGLDPVVRNLAWNGGNVVPAPVAATWEPAFAHDLAWCLLAGLGGLARLDGTSCVIRLSARQVDQRLAEVPVDALERHRRRALVLAGGYRLHEGGPDAALTLVGVGAVMPEVLHAAAELRAGLGREITAVCVTSPNAMFHALQARRGLAEGSDALLTEVFPADRRTPIVTVVDGDPRALSFLAGVHGDPISALGSSAPLPEASGPPGGTPGDTDPGSSASGAGGHAGSGSLARRDTASSRDHRRRPPVELDTIVGTALDLLDETAG